MKKFLLAVLVFSLGCIAYTYNEHQHKLAEMRNSYLEMSLQSIQTDERIQDLYVSALRHEQNLRKSL